MPDARRILIERWRQDPGGSYQSWFLWDQRLKNFRSIRRGVEQVITEIQAGTFGNQYRGSSLETVVGSIAEQRQIFKGADHAFLWKPKLRIPDIYEDRNNQLAFGRFLDTCNCCTTEAEIIDAIHRLDGLKIKGLGPAAANLLYFVHPTLVSPFNTAIVRGYNALTGAKVKLGRWLHRSREITRVCSREMTHEARRSRTMHCEEAIEGSGSPHAEHQSARVQECSAVLSVALAEPRRCAPRWGAAPAP